MLDMLFEQFADNPKVKEFTEQLALLVAQLDRIERKVDALARKEETRTRASPRTRN